MSIRYCLARAIVRLSAPLAPRALRARWREEWLAEIDAVCRSPNFELHTSNFKLLQRTSAAPIDAIAARAWALRASARALLAGAGSDLRQTWRGLLRTPRHVATVVLCLGIGLTVSVAVFSIINSLLYGDIPGIDHRKDLVRVFVSYDNAFGSESVGRGDVVSASPLSQSDLEVLEPQRDPAFTGWAAEGSMGFAVSFDGIATSVSGAFVSARYFDVLGTHPAQGRLLAPGDDAPNAPPAAVIGFHLWRDRFGAAPDIVGRPLLVGTRTYTIVGVTPPRFTGLQPTDLGASPLDNTQLWLPLRDAASWSGAPSVTRSWLTVRARPAPGVTMAAAEVALQASAARLAAAYPDDRRHATFVVSPYGFGAGNSPVAVLAMIALILAVPLSVLAIACANVANLQLARATERARELAVRLALGASRGQIVRLLCLEAALLAALSTAAGWIGASTAIGAARDLFPLALTMDSHVLTFAVLLAIGVTMLSGLAPAWLVTRRSTAAGLQQSGRAGGLAHARLRHSLVVVQISATLVLLIMSGMFVESVRAMRAATPAALDEQVVAPFDLDMLGASPADATRFLNDLRSRLMADTRVRAVSAERLTGFRYRRVGSGAPANDDRADSAGGFITPSWLDATRTPLVAGRAIRPDDGPDVALVSVRFARDFDGGMRAAVGRALEVSTSADAPARLVTVIGVVADVRRHPDDLNPDPAIYLPMPAIAPARFMVRIRTAHPAALVPGVQQIVRDLDPRLPWEHIEPAEAGYLRDLGPIRDLAWSVGGFGILATMLAAAGLFAVTAYVVSLRTREIGIRVAIGATRGDVVRLVLRQSLRLALVGMVVGVGVAVPLAVALQAVFIGVSPVAPLAVVPPVLLILLVSVAASALPARRASSIDPVKALRAD